MAQKKTATTKASHSDEIIALNQTYAQGNFCATRKQARAILTDSNAPELTRQAAARMLKMTGIDPAALLVGFLCAVFTTTVAFLAGA